LFGTVVDPETLSLPILSGKSMKLKAKLEIEDAKGGIIP
jgi:hypothetical protein